VTDSPEPLSAEAEATYFFVLEAARLSPHGKFGRELFARLATLDAASEHPPVDPPMCVGCGEDHHDECQSNQCGCRQRGHAPLAEHPPVDPNDNIDNDEPENPDGDPPIIQRPPVDPLREDWKFVRRWLPTRVVGPNTAAMLAAAARIDAALASPATPRPEGLDVLDEFTEANAVAMLGRLRHGAVKFGGDPDGWRNGYTDSHNMERLRRAVDHLEAAHRNTNDPTEWRKRAADVANQAFMFADPARLSDTGERT
jgi:hypothetical protein